MSNSYIQLGEEIQLLQAELASVKAELERYKKTETDVLAYLSSLKVVDKMSCGQMLDKNIEDLKEGRPMSFTKEEHSRADYFDASEARWWNIQLPNAVQYTKEEHTKAEGFGVSEARWWNYELPNAEQYTKEEHTKAEGFGAWEARVWNNKLPNAVQYTKEEHTKAEGFNALEARWWNRNTKNVKQYTQGELAVLANNLPSGGR